MIVILSIMMLLVLLTPTQQTSYNYTLSLQPPQQAISIELQFGRNTYSQIGKYFTSQQWLQITDMKNDQNNKNYHFCYVQSLLNSYLIEQSCVRFSSGNNNESMRGYVNNNQETKMQSPIIYKLSDIIQAQSILAQYYYSTTINTTNDNTISEIKTENVLIVKSRGIASVRLEESCKKQQSMNNKQYSKQTIMKCDDKQSVVQMLLQKGQFISKAKFIELENYIDNNINSNSNSNNNNNNKYKQLLLLTQSQLYNIRLDETKPTNNNQTQQESTVRIDLLAELKKSDYDEKKQVIQQQQQKDGDEQYSEENGEQFATAIINTATNLNNSSIATPTTIINLLLFTNKNNLHSYNLSITPTKQTVRVQSNTISKLKVNSNSNAYDDEILLLASDDGVEEEFVNYRKDNKESKLLVVAGKSVGDVRVSYNFGVMFNNSTNNTSTNINISKPQFHHLPNTQKCHKIHQYQQQYIFLQCKNHLLYIKISELVDCYNNGNSKSKTQQCLNNVKQSHINLGYHIQAVHFQQQQQHYLTITTIDKYSHFYIDYCKQTKKINSINNAGTYYYSNQTLKSVFKTSAGRSIVTTKENVAVVRQEEDEKEIYCKTVDQHSRKKLGQPIGRFTGAVVVEGVCKNALLVSNGTFIIQSVQNSTLCRYSVPLTVTITHTAKQYKSIWYILLATGLTTITISLIFCAIKSHKLKQIYKVLQEEKEHGQQVLQGTVVTEVNQSQEESIGVGMEVALGK